ncbi:RNA-binding protein Nova-1 [Cichlidogyrus casuarinus]|uniref:RNA-binding protein Nova-1 n=1 Tax=Cichlidogyrus casuarinus TaxID=1844966 RepID=A0ABD2QMD5_9PLAT
MSDGLELKKIREFNCFNIHYSTKVDKNNVHLKVLIPSVAAGAIIGKNGEAIIQVSKQTGAKVKLSKADDFYPGTTERVCLIQGNLEAVTKMHLYIMDRIYEKSESLNNSSSSAASQQLPPPSPSPPPPPPLPMDTKNAESEGTVTLWSSGQRSTSTMPTKVQWERHQQVKILVPNCTAGLIIGKRGAFVNVIKQETGAWVQVSQKSEHIDLAERCITIAG